MKRVLANLKPTFRAGLLVGVLGLIAAFAGSPYQGSQFTIDAQELARVVETTTDHVTPEELADWIIQGRADYRLIDLRTAQEYGEYHIPGAENFGLTALPDAGLQKSEKIVLYSEGGIHAAQAWFLLKAKGYSGVYMLFGGLDGWKDDVLFPSLAANPTPAQTVQFGKMKEVSKFFGGAPRSGGTDSAQTPSYALPKVEMPQSVEASPASTPKKKKKEGC
ncbi:MAG: rhodanese-like domain-containing protein [Bacteroidetes bacterium]|nr:rhodanese-like domain-containing protein [Bacteroidota bacterium]